MVHTLERLRVGRRVSMGLAWSYTRDAQALEHVERNRARVRPDAEVGWPRSGLGVANDGGL